MKTNGELSSKQLEAIVCLAENPSISKASKEAGVSRSTLHRWLKRPDFRAVLESAKKEQFLLAQEQLRSLVPMAVEGLKELAQSSKEQIRIRACVEILKAAGTYGTQNSAYLALEDLDLQCRDTYRGELTEKVLRKLATGIIPSNAALPLLKASNHLESLREPFDLMRFLSEGGAKDIERAAAEIEAGRRLGKSAKQIFCEMEIETLEEKLEQEKRRLQAILSSRDAKAAHLAEIEKELEEKFGDGKE